MKRVISGLLAATVLTGVSTLGGLARADEVIVKSPQAVVEPTPVRAHEYYERRGWRMERAGIITAVLGTALVITGAAVAGASLQNHHDNWTGATTAGTVILAPGALLMGIGIPLWAFGDAAGRRRVELSAAPNGVVGRF